MFSPTRIQITTITLLIFLLVAVTLTAFIRWHFYSPPIKPITYSVVYEVFLQTKLAAIGIEIDDYEETERTFAIKPYTDIKNSRRVGFSSKELMYLLKRSSLGNTIEIKIEEGQAYINTFVNVDKNLWFIGGKRVRVSTKINVVGNGNNSKITVVPKKLFSGKLYLESGQQLHEIDMMSLLNFNQIKEKNVLQLIKFVDDRVVVYIKKPE